MEHIFSARHVSNALLNSIPKVLLQSCCVMTVMWIYVENHFTIFHRRCSWPDTWRLQAPESR